MYVRRSAPKHRPLTAREQLVEWGIEDAVSVLTEEQPEHFAFDTASVGDATPGGLDSLPKMLCSWIAGRYFDGANTDREEWPTAEETAVYSHAYRRAMHAGIRACEEGCAADDYDADEVTSAAAEAARATGRD